MLPIIIPNNQTVLIIFKRQTTYTRRQGKVTRFVLFGAGLFCPPARVVGSTSKSSRTSRLDWSSLGALAGTACNCFIPAGK